MLCKGGEWVRFKVSVFIDSNYIILGGTYGVVADVPYGYVCTPGISTMIYPVGAEEPYGCSDEWFDILESEPSEEDIAASLYIWENAFEIYEEEFGYTGFIKVKNQILPQSKVLNDISRQTELMVKFKMREKKKMLKGKLKKNSFLT